VGPCPCPGLSRRSTRAQETRGNSIGKTKAKEIDPFAPSALTPFVRQRQKRKESREAPHLLPHPPPPPPPPPLPSPHPSASCMPKSQKPDGMVAGSTKRLASRFYQLKTGHCRIGQYLHWSKSRPTGQSRRETTSSKCVRSGRASRRSCGRRCGRRQEGGRAGGRSGICSQMEGVVRQCWISFLLRTWEG